jgi:hypothetical protein
MPFDGRSPSPVVEIFDTLSEFLRRGDDLTWMQYPKTGSAPRGVWLLEATDRVRHAYVRGVEKAACEGRATLLENVRRMLCEAEATYAGETVTFDQLARLLATAIQGSASTRPDLNNKAVNEYNDAKGRTLEDILAVIRKAKTLARESA